VIRNPHFRLLSPKIKFAEQKVYVNLPCYLMNPHLMLIKTECLGVEEIEEEPPA
jgi:hypothetical protein